MSPLRKVARDGGTAAGIVAIDTGDFDFVGDMVEQMQRDEVADLKQSRQRLEVRERMHGRGCDAVRTFHQQAETEKLPCRSEKKERSKTASDFGNAPLDPPAAGDLSRSDKSGARALVRSESDVRAAMSSPTILHAGSDEEGDADASGPKSANSSLLSARRGFSVGQRRSRQLSSNPGSFMSFSSGQLRPRRRLSMRARRASAIDGMATKHDTLAEAVRREKAERVAVVQEVLSMQNVVKNSKKAVENSDRRIRALVKELDEMYDECPRLDRRLPEIKDGFLYKDMALASAIRLWVDQTGGIGIDMKAEGKEEIAPFAMQNVSPYSGGLS